MSELLKYNTKGLRCAMLYYNIMCQYLVHMMSQFKNNPYLELPTGLTHIAKAMRLFHVYGHKDECFAQYAPSFILGAGIVDGEIIETLWEPLNPIAPSARKASPKHHWEIMDDDMNHSNWKKLICISQLSILRWTYAISWFQTWVACLWVKYPAAVKELVKAEVALQSIESTSQSNLVKEWKTHEEDAQANQDQDVSSMDIYSRKQNCLHVFQFQQDHLILALINIQNSWIYYRICSNISYNEDIGTTSYVHIWPCNHMMNTAVTCECYNWYPLFTFFP